MPLLARIRKQRVPKGHIPNGTFRHPSKKGMYP